jgi:hypothetical protein
MEMLVLLAKLYNVFTIIGKWLYLLLPRMKNLLLRPKLKLEIKNQRLVFIGDGNKEHHYPYLCLTLCNSSKNDYHVNLNSLLINNELYTVLIQTEVNFLKLNPNNPSSWERCNCEIYNTYQRNWLEILQGNFDYEIKPFKKQIFPIKPTNARSHCMTSVKKNSLLFFSKNKISITLEINQKIYEYGLNRKLCYEYLINYLAFYHETPF